jgi:hypothetical protein
MYIKYIRADSLTGVKTNGATPLILVRVKTARITSFSIIFLISINDIHSNHIITFYLILFLILTQQFFIFSFINTTILKHRFIPFVIIKGM